MTDHIHTCFPGCTECDRAERIANDIEQIVTLSWAAATAEIRALHAQREALTQEVARLREALTHIDSAACYASLAGAALAWKTNV